MHTEIISKIALSTLGRWPHGAHITFSFLEPNKRRDPDNFTSVAAKFVLDGLVRAGVLPGDGWGHVLSLRYMWDVDAERPGIIVTLSEAP